jgi:predicted DCC family thiol-disulfide oxidoreductase YuxK
VISSPLDYRPGRRFRLTPYNAARQLRFLLVYEHPVILFDGVCGLCNRWITFVLERDRKAMFRFAALQSDAARVLLAAHALPPDQLESVVLVAEGRVYVRSAAVIEILRRLGFPWSAARLGAIVPTRIRDAVYDFVARHRYRWFGSTETCRMPTPSERARFISS